MKKYLILLIISICLCGCNKQVNDTNNFYTKEKNGDMYNVYINSYNGEYSSYTPRDILDDIQQNRNWSDYDNFEGIHLFTYDEYCNYCKEYNLKQDFNSDKSKYIVASDLTTGWYTNQELVDVVVNDKTAIIYIMEETYGTTTGDVSGYNITIPVDLDIENVNYEMVFTEEYIDNMIEIQYNPDIQTEDKPVIYLYPEKEMDVSVKLNYTGTLTTTYPKYENGWKVKARPDGTLIHENQFFNYLYWEGSSTIDYDFSKGFCVRGEDTAKFLEEKLSALGLNRKEANEFIVYWLPRMENNKYNIISFQTDVYTDNAQLIINPEPDCIIRVFMAYYPSDKFISIPSQNISSPKRLGFSVIEWGGCEVCK